MSYGNTASLLENATQPSAVQLNQNNNQPENVEAGLQRYLYPTHKRSREEQIRLVLFVLNLFNQLFVVIATYTESNLKGKNFFRGFIEISTFASLFTNLVLNGCYSEGALENIHNDLKDILNLLEQKKYAEASSKCIELLTTSVIAGVSAKIYVDLGKSSPFFQNPVAKTLYPPLGIIAFGLLNYSGAAGLLKHLNNIHLLFDEEIRSFFSPRLSLNIQQADCQAEIQRQLLSHQRELMRRAGQMLRGTTQPSEAFNNAKKDLITNLQLRENLNIGTALRGFLAVVNDIPETTFRRNATDSLFYKGFEAGTQVTVALSLIGLLENVEDQDTFLVALAVILTNLGFASIAARDFCQLMAQFFTKANRNFVAANYSFKAKARFTLGVLAVIAALTFVPSLDSTLHHFKHQQLSFFGKLLEILGASIGTAAFNSSAFWLCVNVLFTVYHSKAAKKILSSEAGNNQLNPEQEDALITSLFDNYLQRLERLPFQLVAEEAQGLPVPLGCPLVNNWGQITADTQPGSTRGEIARRSVVPAAVLAGAWALHNFLLGSLLPTGNPSDGTDLPEHGKEVVRQFLALILAAGIYTPFTNWLEKKLSEPKAGEEQVLDPTPPHIARQNIQSVFFRTQTTKTLVTESVLKVFEIGAKALGARMLFGLLGFEGAVLDNLIMTLVLALSFGTMRGATARAQAATPAQLVEIQPSQISSANPQ